MNSFNPCFIGTYSFTNDEEFKEDVISRCFNPCFIGTYSFTKLSCHYHNIYYIVLILVLLELILLLVTPKHIEITNSYRLYNF